VLGDLGVVERYRAVLEVLDEGVPVTEVARRYGVGAWLAWVALAEPGDVVGDGSVGVVGGLEELRQPRVAGRTPPHQGGFQRRHVGDRDMPR
jgi:transposase-like protein